MRLKHKKIGASPKQKYRKGKLFTSPATPPKKSKKKVKKVKTFTK